MKDLPVLMCRIEMLETMGPLAIDESNLNAQEAYKDLWNLLEVAIGNGCPDKV